MILYILAAACVAVSVPTAVLRHKGRERGRIVAKLTASVLFCLVAFWAAALREVPMNFQATLMLAGLVLGLMGDIVLGVDKFVPKEHRGYILLIGGIPFFIGHVAYIALLASYGELNPWLLLIVPLLPLLFLLMHKSLNFGKMFIPSLLYALVLSAMMVFTFNVALQGGPLGRLMILPGLFFTISDTSLFLNKFGAEKLGRFVPVFTYTVPIFYFSAQALFALSLRYL